MTVKKKSKKGRPPHGMTGGMFGFCSAYIENGFTNATSSYKKAYPKCRGDKAARACAARLLTKDNVQAYLEEVKERAAEKAQLTADRLFTEVRRLALSDLVNIVNWNSENGTLKITVKDSADLPPEITAAIKKIKTKTIIVHQDDEQRVEKVEMEIELYDKTGAIDKAMRHLGMYKDSMQLTGPDGKALIDHGALTAIREMIADAEARGEKL